MELRPTELALRGMVARLVLGSVRLGGCRRLLQDCVGADGSAVRGQVKKGDHVLAGGLIQAFIVSYTFMSLISVQFAVQVEGFHSPAC